METPQDVIRRYWRDKKRVQRAAQKKVVFEPHITEFQRCSFCGEWHPVAFILASGRYSQVSLDSYHSKESIVEWLRGLMATLPKPKGYIDHETAMELSTRQLMADEGYEKDEAEKQAKKLILNDDYRTRLIKLDRDERRLENITDLRLRMCTRSRMQLYKENEQTAILHCEIIVNDPLMRHAPPGVPLEPVESFLSQATDVIVPVEICKDLDVSLTKDPTIIALGRCFTQKMRKQPDMDPQEAVEECMSELRSTEQGDLKKPAVGDLFGKSAAEIRAMSKRKQDPSFTVGDLSGLTQKQILRMQRHGWDQDDNAAFEACVREKMEKEHMTRKEAEEACEALSASSADRAGAKKKLPLAEGVAGQIHV